MPSSPPPPPPPAYSRRRPSLKSIHPTPTPTTIEHVYITRHSSLLHREPASKLSIRRIDHPHRRSHLGHHRHLAHHHLLQHQRVGLSHAHRIHVQPTHRIRREPSHHDVRVRRRIGDVIDTSLDVI